MAVGDARWISNGAGGSDPAIDVVEEPRRREIGSLNFQIIYCPIPNI
jgi:hypothetical protein